MLNLLATSSTTEDRDPDQVHPPCVLASLGVPLRPARMEALGTVSCSIAHDLNNVLTPILLGLDTLQQEDISRRARLALAIIESNTRRAADLVDQITAFALGAERPRILMNAGNIIREVARTARMSARKGPSVSTRIPAGLWRVKGDPGQIHRVLTNLATNACEAMGGKGELRITAENIRIEASRESDPRSLGSGDYVRISVSDSGPGIPLDLRDRIFAPFFTTKATGTGLGLTTSAKMAASQGGLLTLGRTDDAGSDFHLFLPAA